MKIIVCGAGNVGRSIVSYLVQGNNEIIVIDNDQKNLDMLAKEWDVMPILGSSSHPDILEKADAEHADLLIAATDDDEVNMITCQLAYTFFKVPQKIARIDSEVFLDPIWGNFYNDHNMPIDKIISPDLEIAKSIFATLKIPGTSEVLSFADERIYLISFKCQESNPFRKTPLLNFERIVPDLDISIVSIVRNRTSFIPKPTDTFELGDEIFFLVAEKKLEDALHAFKIEQSSNEKLIIFGGSKISGYLAEMVERDDNFERCTIIADDYKVSKYLASSLEDTVVIKGEMMSDVILDEADIGSVDATVAVTENDKDNLLVSLIAKKRNVNTNLSLVNSRSYGNLIDNIGDSVLIDRSAVTISSILKELRKSRITSAHALGRGFGEVWELKIDNCDEICNKKISDLKLPANSRVCMILRNDEIIITKPTDKIFKDDIIILFVSTNDIKKIETIFA